MPCLTHITQPTRLVRLSASGTRAALTAAEQAAVQLVFGADRLGGLWGRELQYAIPDASSLYLASLALGVR